MKFTTLTSDLKRETILTSHFISAKAQLPILGSILLKTEGNKLFLISTNLETSVSTSIPAKVEEDGEIAVPGRVFTDLIGNLSSDHVEVSQEKEKIKIESQGFKSNLSGMNALDFPKVPNKLGKNIFSLEAELFLNLLSKVVFSVGVDDTRPILTGVLFEIKEKTLSLVSTDGFRLSKISEKITTEFDGEITFVVPKSILIEISKVLAGGSIDFSVDSQDNQIIFKYADSVFSSRLIEGSFPDYNKIIPLNFLVNLKIDRVSFEKSIKLASVIARESGNIIKIKVGQDSLKVFAQNQNYGEQENEVEIVREKETTQQIEISFNYRFVEDLLKNINSEEILMCLNDSNSAAMFLSEKEKNFFHLIMPIRV